MKRVLSTLGAIALVALLALIALRLAGVVQIQWRPPQKNPGGGHGGDGHGEHEEGKSHVKDGKIVLDEESLRAAAVKTSPAIVGSLAVALRVTGEIALSEDRLAHVTPRIPGAVRAVHRTLGDLVGPGDPLVTIESVELGEARASHVSAHAEVTLAKRSFERWKELFEKGLKTQNELWASESELTRAGIRHEGATGKLKALGIDDEEHIAALDSRTLNNHYVVKSPLAGTVLERHATLGENVEGKDVLFLVADLSEVWVQAAVYEKDLARLRKGFEATVRTQAFPDAPFRGTVTYVGQRVDEKSRTVPLRVSVKNAPAKDSTEPFALRPGMFATVDIETSRREGVVLVPATAVQTVNGQTVVFVHAGGQDDDHDPGDGHDHGTKPAKKDADHGPGDGHDHGAKPAKKDDPGAPATKGAVFEARRVVVGERSEDVVEIVKGLKPGEHVVIENAYLLKSELEKSRISEGHAH